MGMAAIGQSAFLVEAVKSQPVGDIRRGVLLGVQAWNPRARSQRAPAPQPSNPHQLVLGQALAGRIADATRLTAEAAAAAGLFELASRQFARQIHDVHNLTTRAIARFLVTGQGTTETERNFIGRLGAMSFRYGLPLGCMVRSYFLWRDTNLKVLREEVSRLSTPLAVYEQARMIIRSSADAGIMRLTEAYDYQLQVVRSVPRPCDPGSPSRPLLSRLRALEGP